MRKKAGLCSPGKKTLKDAVPPNHEAFDLAMLANKPWTRPFSLYDPVVCSKAIESDLTIAPCPLFPETEYSLYAGKHYDEGDNIHIIGEPTLDHQDVCDLVVDPKFRSRNAEGKKRKVTDCRHIHEFATLDRMPDAYLNDPESSHNLFCDLTELRDPTIFVQSCSNARGNVDKKNCTFAAVTIKKKDTLVLRATTEIEPGDELLEDYWDASDEPTEVETKGDDDERKKKKKTKKKTTQ